MSNGFFKVPVPKNEPVLSYAPGTKERAALKSALAEARSKELDIPMYIGAEEVRTGNKRNYRRRTIISMCLVISTPATKAM